MDVTCILLTSHTACTYQINYILSCSPSCRVCGLAASGGHGQHPALYLPAHAALTGLRHAPSSTHPRGLPLCEVYGRHAERSSRAQGSILTFNVVWADGSYVGFGEVGEKAAAEGIQLRVGE